MPLLRGPYNARPPAGAAPHSGGRRRKRAGLELLLRNPLFFLIFAVRVSQKFCRATDKISTDDDILSLLGCAEYRVYFKNLMYRLVLHGGSHKEDQVKAMKDMNFFTLISEREKKRTAKDILCFIYLLNKAHLLSHLKEIDSDAETKLDSWCQDIRRRSVVI